ncbi:MAG: response regulator [Myxococcales bacterium]|nr:response regulator [Myxococcales bacterium]
MGQAASPVLSPAYICRVLVCDDEDRLADLTAALLRHFGFFAEAVADGARAVAAMRAEPGFDVLILDLNLRGTSSAEVIRALRDDGGLARVVITSGYAEEDVPVALMQEPNVVGYLPKPYPAERLVATVREAFEDS